MALVRMMFFSWILFSTVIYSATSDECPEGEPVRHFDANNGTNPSVFDDLTVDEIRRVYNYLRSQPELNVVDRDQIKLDKTFIHHIERLPAPKSQVLNYLDNGGAKPERFAWVILYRGDLSPPVVEEYKVGPLPLIDGYERLQIFGQDSVEYIRRHSLSAADVPELTTFVSSGLEKVDHILEKVTGYKGNNCGFNCLVWLPGSPGQYKSGDRSMWFTMVRTVEGHYLHPVGLQFRADVNDIDPTKWVVNFVYFRGEEFTDFDDMAAKYVLPPTFDSGIGDPTSKNLYSSLNHRGDPKPEKKQRGPVSFMPDGRRYKVDGHNVQWQGWHFDFNIRSIAGLQVHDVKFNAERIAYEIGLSELGVLYSGSSPAQQHAAFIDSPLGFGMESYELIPGVDCPDHATYFDFAHYLNTYPVLFTKSACIFEQNKGLPIRRHYETNHAGGFYFIQGMPGNVLILRSVITVSNYEYILDFQFHQNGALEVSVSLSGYILSSYYTGMPGNDRHGFEVFPNGQGVIHNHLANFKVDLDVGQRRNRFETLDIQLEEINDPANGAEKIFIHKFERNLRETELNATYSYNLDTPKYLVFFDNDAENKYGNKKGYRLYPVNVNKQLLPKDWTVEKGFSFARYQVAVTKQKDSERENAWIHNMVDNVEPVVNFQEFIDNDENIVDEDLVAWVTLGAFHIPHSEDIPIVQTPSLSLTFYLLPFNYFDEDPSLASRDNIRITPRSDGSKKMEYVGVSPDVDCTPGKTSAASFVSLPATLMVSVFITFSRYFILVVHF